MKPTPITADVADLAKAWNIEVEVDETPQDEFEVAEANWASLLFFLAAETQWRVIAGMGFVLWIGLDYVACDVIARRMEVPDHAWPDLKTMENAALAVMNEKTD